MSVFCRSFIFLAAGALLAAAPEQTRPGFPNPIRGVAYPARSLPMPATPCSYARDLPLIAVMGANTVRTYGLLPEGDRTFLPVLDSTGLSWIAGFPLDSFYDPSRTITARKAEILTAFRQYATRFHGQRRVIAYVFGEEVTADYHQKFAGEPAEFYTVLTEAAAVLREIEPGGAPALATAVGDETQMTADVPGLTFWCWNTHGSATVRPTVAVTRPILISEDGGAATEAESGTLGGVYASFRSAGEGGIFHTSASSAGPDSLAPLPLYYRLASLWRGTFPSSWSEKEAPQVSEPDGPAAAGVLLRVHGSALVGSNTPYSDETWPFSIADTCLCVDGSPARLSYLSADAITAQVPPSAGPGARTLVVYRAGRASNTATLHVSELSTVTFAGPVLEARLH